MSPGSANRTTRETSYSHYPSRIDPPPDLVIEVDITSSSRRRFEVYRQLGVPEIWRYLGQTVRINQLQEGEYVERDYSPTFPFVSAAIINQFLQRAETTDDTTVRFV